MHSYVHHSLRLHAFTLGYIHFSALPNPTELSYTVWCITLVLQICVLFPAFRYYDMDVGFSVQL